jgi:hypothetical protein
MTKKHKWFEVPGWFRKYQCPDCNAVKQWDSSFGRIVYYSGTGIGPLFWAPKCEIKISTDAPVKL